MSDPLRLSAADALEATTCRPRVLVGFDGFLDSITSAVGTRRSMQAEDFEPMRTIDALASRIAGAGGGRSVNIELRERELRAGGNGPLLMELKTYRYRGHSMSDPAKYRSREEVQNVKEKSDPIEAAKAELLKMGVSEDAMKAIDKEIRTVVSEAADFAETSPEPDPSELYTDVLVEQY